jgi:xylan 1,4-beta-xylosidase
MNMANQLRSVDRGFGIVASYPETRKLPIIIGESDPEGCAACQGDHLGYRNGTMYSSYTAASFVRKLDLAEKYGVNFEGALTWAFEFEDQPYFAGFRSLATNGINKPVLNVFRMFSMMEGKRVSVHSTAKVPMDTILRRSVRGHPDVWAYASYTKNALYIMAWHYHDDDVEGPVARIRFELQNLPLADGTASLDQYLIDKEHSNAYTAWQKMGSPQNPDPDQYRKLEQSSQLEKVTGEKEIDVRDSTAILDLVLQRQGVTLLVIRY